MDLIDVLHAKQGIICAVGAGGKKTTLFKLASLHGGRVGVTTTVQLPPFPSNLPGKRVIAPADTLLEQVIAASQQHRIVAFAHPSDKYRRVAGVTTELLNEIQAQAQFDVLLVKADGARQKPLKAPAHYEPVIPPNTNTVLTVLSIGVVGKTLTEDIAHRIELIEAITAAKRGELIRPEHLAQLLVSEQGLLKNIGSAKIMPVINQVDDDERYVQARAVAQQALSMTDHFDEVVLTAMRRANAVVDIVKR